MQDQQIIELESKNPAEELSFCLQTWSYIVP